VSRAWRRHVPDVLILLLVVGGLGWLTVNGAQAMNYQWQWYRIPAFFWRVVDGDGFPGPLLNGLLVTLRIAALSIVITLALGLLTALLRMSPSWAARGLATLYLEVVRNTPILVQIYIFYFVLAPIIGLNRFTVGVLGLSFFEATLAAEAIRGGIQAVPRGQQEAARALGLRGHQVLRLVVLPQALPLMLPPLTGVLINLVKNSAIVSVIAIADLATEARNLISDTLMSFEIWLTVAAVYLSITLPLSAAAQWLEHRLSRRATASRPT
jgi:polar amino acid transport system permease protein